MIRERVLPRLARGAPERDRVQRGHRPDVARRPARAARRRARSSRTRRRRLPNGAGLPVRDDRRSLGAAQRRLRAAGRPRTAQRFPRPARPARRVHRRPPTRSRAAGCRCSRTWRAATASTSSARTTSRRSASRTTRPRSTPSATPTCRGPTPCSWRRARRSTTRPSCGRPTRCAAEGPRPLRNVVQQNKKVPLTDDREDPPGGARAEHGP